MAFVATFLDIDFYSVLISRLSGHRGQYSKGGERDKNSFHGTFSVCDKSCDISH
ncbi:hypothetical protein [Klebsiella aerogenes EA1509E]|nr:hypothetical protein [Klebsiella aerogenes EA1509E]